MLSQGTRGEKMDKKERDRLVAQHRQARLDRIARRQKAANADAVFWVALGAVAMVGFIIIELWHAISG